MWPPFAPALVGILLLAGVSFAQEVTTKNQSVRRPANTICVTDFFPKGYVKDGSIRYQKQIQTAIDTAAKTKSKLVFPPIVYSLDESGLKLHSHLALSTYGAIFRLDEKCKSDGQAFHGHNVSGIQILGGEIVGRNDVWREGVNIRGIFITGNSTNIRIRDVHIRDLSSNGIGIFGTEKQLIRDVWITDTVIENCCNRYGDYLSDKVGPEKGSVREDQGLVAFYWVKDFVVRGCRFEKSRSDGTHFYKCRQGQFIDNKVYDAQMGGYFVETCDDILASNNVIRGNGSRGATIERGSHNCTLVGNVVAQSGREGLWAPDCTGLIITGNIFKYNVRKPNGEKRHQIWNANITVNKSRYDPTKSPTKDYLIANNILYTSKSQVAAIRVDANETTSRIVVRDNMLRGENKRLQVEGTKAKSVVVQGNK